MYSFFSLPRETRTDEILPSLHVNDLRNLRLVNKQLSSESLEVIFRQLNTTVAAEQNKLLRLRTNPSRLSLANFKDKNYDFYGRFAGLLIIATHNNITLSIQEEMIDELISAAADSSSYRKCMLASELLCLIVQYLNPRQIILMLKLVHTHLKEWHQNQFNHKMRQIDHDMFTALLPRLNHQQISDLLKFTLHELDNARDIFVSKKIRKTLAILFSHISDKQLIETTVTGIVDIIKDNDHHHSEGNTLKELVPYLKDTQQVATLYKKVSGLSGSFCGIRETRLRILTSLSLRLGGNQEITTMFNSARGSSTDDAGQVATVALNSLAMLFPRLSEEQKNDPQLIERVLTDVLKPRCRSAPVATVLAELFPFLNPPQATKALNALLRQLDDDYFKEIAITALKALKVIIPLLRVEQFSLVFDRLLGKLDDVKVYKKVNKVLIELIPHLDNKQLTSLHSQTLAMLKSGFVYHDLLGRRLLAALVPWLTNEQVQLLLPDLLSSFRDSTSLPSGRFKLLAAIFTRLTSQQQAEIIQNNILANLHSNSYRIIKKLILLFNDEQASTVISAYVASLNALVDDYLLLKTCKAIMLRINENQIALMLPAIIAMLNRGSRFEYDALQILPDLLSRLPNDQSSSVTTSLLAHLVSHPDGEKTIHLISQLIALEKLDVKLLRETQIDSCGIAGKWLCFFAEKYTEVKDVVNSELNRVLRPLGSQ